MRHARCSIDRTSISAIQEDGKSPGKPGEKGIVVKLKFLFLGKTKERYLADGIADFLKRIKPYVQVEEVELKGTRVREERAAEVIAEDTKRLLAAVKPDEFFVHLDPGGKEFTSEELADWLKQQMESGVKTISFGMGGPLGLDDSAAKRANLRLCMSRFTLTHEMCRLLLLEQIYRALRIGAGHPYHK